MVNLNVNFNQSSLKTLDSKGKFNWLHLTIVTRNRQFGNTGRTGRSTYLCWEPSYARTQFFFTGHQNVNKPKSRAAKTVHGLIFLPFYKIIASFFSFLCQDANKTRSNCAIIGCNLSKKHKLTQNGESNYVDHKFFFNFYQELPTCTKPWRQTSKYYRAG